MHFNFKKVIAGSLATAMLITNFSINSLSNVSAANEAYPTSGKCGEKATWLINSDGVLVISGTGGMAQGSDASGDSWGWSKFGDSVKEVVIEDGITAASAQIEPFGELFCRYISKITLPPSLITLKKALGYVSDLNNLKDIYIYSKNITDTAYQNEYQSKKYPGGIIWHVYKDSDTERSLRNDLKLTDEDIEYIPDNEQMPTVNNKTPVELEPVTEISGPSGMFSKWEWNETNKTLTFSGKDRITIADNYKQYAEETEHIVINEGITHLNANTGIVTVGGSGVSSYYSGSFTGFTSLKDVKLPDTLQEISASSFRGASLEEINFPKALNKIGEGAFGFCSKLKSIKLHEGMTIGGGAFTNCESLKEVTIPKNVTFEAVKFGGAGMVRAHSTFANCTGIEKVVIEDGSVLKDTWEKAYTQDGIPENFFTACSSLKTVIIKGDVDYIADKAFGGLTNGGCPLITNIYLYNTNLKTITAKKTLAGSNESYGYVDSFDTTNNPTFHVIKGSQTEQTLREAGYLDDNNTKYLPDITTLETVIADAEKINTSKYSDNTLINNLKTVLENAKSVRDNLDATQEDVDAAVKALNDAISALTKPNTSVTPTSPTTKPSSTRSPEVVKKDKTTAENLMKQAKITKLTVKSKSKKNINVTWKKVKTAVGYQVQVSKKSNFKKRILNKFTTKKKLTINKKIKSGKTYFVRVRAYATYKDAFGKPQKVYSKWNKKLRKVKVK